MLIRFAKNKKERSGQQEIHFLNYQACSFANFWEFAKMCAIFLNTALSGTCQAEQCPSPCLALRGTVHCFKINLNLCIQFEQVTAGGDATVHDWLLGTETRHISCTVQYLLPLHRRCGGPVVSVTVLNLLPMPPHFGSRVGRLSCE